MHLTNSRPYLERTLSPQRLQHSLGVMQIMQELTEIYHLDETQAQQNVEQTAVEVSATLQVEARFFEWE